MNYYKILQLTTTASKEEIESAYHRLIEKWRGLRAQQIPENQQRSDKIITLLEEAYQVLSDEKKRAHYDHQLDHGTPPPSPTTSSQNSPQETAPTKKGRMLLWAILVIILVIVAIIYVLFIPNSLFSQPDTTALEATPVSSTKQAASPQPKKGLLQEELTSPKKDHVITQQDNKTQEGAGQKIQDSKPVKKETQDKDAASTTAVGSKKISADQLKNANDPSLKETAKQLAESTNLHKKVVINLNTQFLEAKASNQNVTIKFMVIDGISNSRTILDSYLTERFFYDNQICEIQKSNIEKGILFTFAYYNTKKELVGKYYIDQEVCESPMEKRLVKTPNEYQLNSIEIGEDGKPIAQKDESN